MATEKVICSDTATAAADLSTKQFTLVRFDSSGNLIAASAATQNAFVLIDNPKLNQHGTIALVGIAKCVAGGTVAAGDLLTSDSSGRVVTASTGNRIVGTALRAAVVSDVVSLRVEHGTA